MTRSMPCANARYRSRLIPKLLWASANCRWRYCRRQYGMHDVPAFALPLVVLYVFSFMSFACDHSVHG